MFLIIHPSSSQFLMASAVPLGLDVVAWSTKIMPGFLSKTTLTFTHRWFRRRLTLTGLIQVVITTEWKSISLGWNRFETFLQEVYFSSSEYALKIHSWMVSSQPHLGDHNRIKIWYTWVTQVRNLLTLSCFFLSGYPLKFAHGQFPRGIHSTSSWPLKWVPQQNPNLSLWICQCRFETYRRQLFFLSEHDGLEDLLMDNFLRGPS